MFRYTQRDAKKLFISNFVILLRTALKLNNEDRIINDKIEANFVFVFVYGIFSIIVVIIYVRPDKPHVIHKLAIKSQAFLKHALYKKPDFSINQPSINLFFTVRHHVCVRIEKNEKAFY